MEKGKEITAREIIYFYIGKEKNLPLTDWIMDNGYGQDFGSEYIGFANERKTDDKQVMQILREKEAELKRTKEFCWLKALYDSKEVFLSKEEQRKPNQKWHLLISYYAFSLIVRKYKIDSKVNGFDSIDGMKPTVIGRINCPELCLWMVEAAKDGELLTADEVEELFHQIVEFKRQRIGQWDSFSWWKENKGKYDTKLVEIILKEKERGEKIYETQITHE